MWIFTFWKWGKRAEYDFAALAVLMQTALTKAILCYRSKSCWFFKLLKNSKGLKTFRHKLVVIIGTPSNVTALLSARGITATALKRCCSQPCCKFTRTPDSIWRFHTHLLCVEESNMLALNLNPSMHLLNAFNYFFKDSLGEWCFRLNGLEEAWTPMHKVTNDFLTNKTFNMVMTIHVWVKHHNKWCYKA